MISSSEIKYFIEVARVGNVSRAAERLGVTQPALSHCLKKMEQHMGAQLFLRSKKGVELTPSGKRLFENALILESQWEELLRSIHNDTELPSGLIRLGCHTAVAQYTLPQILPLLSRDYPHIKFKLHHDLSRKLTEEVISSKIDVAFVVNPPQHNDLVIKEICRDVVTIWTSKKCLGPELLILDPSLNQSQKILKDLGKKKNPFKKHMESSSLEVIAQLLVSGVGQAILPTRVVHALHPKNVEVPSWAPSVEDQICLVFKPEFKRTKRGQIFIESVKGF